MSRVGEQSRDRGIDHARTKLEVSEFRIPAGDRSIVLRDRGESVSACRSRRIRVKPGLEDLTMSRIQPRRDEGRLPEPGGVLDGIVAHEVLHLSNLGGEI